MGDENTSILALDVGAARIGVALASRVARLASPYGWVLNDAAVFEAVQNICKREHVGRIVVGLPRGMNGQDTQQTEGVRAFGEQILERVGLPVSWQDEAVTSIRAEAELQARGKHYQKGDIDALSATYILEDYLHENV